MGFKIEEVRVLIGKKVERDEFGLRIVGEVIFGCFRVRYNIDMVGMEWWGGMVID